MPVPDPLSINKEWWEKMADEGQGFTRPWLNLDKNAVLEYAQGGPNPFPNLLDVYPASVLLDIRGREVLCLASGGGQQSAVFGILGANVTVVDIAEGQLEGDRIAAQHYGYQVKTIQSDMSDLHMLADKSFDLVYQAPSMAYIPNVRKVYAEVARILKPGGLYRADAHNPQVQFIDEASWDGTGYRISVPYRIKERKRPNENVIEFRHHLDEIFNGLIELGFIMERVVEMPTDLYQGKDEPESGTWSHSLKYAPGIFAILARKI